MGSRLIAIACLVVSLLSAPALVRADYRSDHEGVRTGAGPMSSAARRAPSHGYRPPATSGAEQMAARGERSSRLPRLVLFALAVGGAWWAYRKYGHQVPRAQFARMGGVAAVGLGLAYLLFAGRTGPREVAIQPASRTSSRDDTRLRTDRSTNPYAPSEVDDRRYATDAIPDNELATSDRSSGSTTRRGRISATRRGTLYDHSSRNSTPIVAEPEPEIPHDPELIAAISQSGGGSSRNRPPALFVDSTARPIDSPQTQSPAARQTADSSTVREQVSATSASGRTKSTATTPPATPSTPANPRPETTKTKVAPRIAAATSAASTKSPSAPATSATDSAATTVSATAVAKKEATGATTSKKNSPASGKGPSSAKASSVSPPIASPTAPAADQGVVPAQYQPPQNSTGSGSSGSSSGSGSTSNDGGSGQSGAIGIAPPKEVPEFLRQESVLLDPGEYQIEVGFLYTLTQSSSVLQLNTGDATFVGDLERRQRLMLTNLDFRIGVTPKLQASVMIPFGWSSGELVFAGQDQVSSSGGIGDVNVSLTRLISEGDANSSQILMNFGMSAPTGESNFVSSVSTPGSQLGQGFYTMTGGITFVRVFDPLVLFGGFGFQHRFDTEVAPGVTLSPGELAYYRFGLGWAVNTRITLNGSFSGSYLTDIELNQRRVAGSAREPMSIRLAATIARAKRNSETKPKVRTVEPHITFGLTESAPAVQMGISWSY